MEQFEGINLTVLSSLSLIAMNDVESIPATNTFTTDDIVLKNGKDWVEIKFTHQSANFAENEKIENGNFFWEKEVNFSIPKLRNEISEELSNLERRKLYALATDINGEMHLVFPLRMYRAKQISGQADGVNAYRVQLTGRDTKESPFITQGSGSDSGSVGV